MAESILQTEFAQPPIRFFDAARWKKRFFFASEPKGIWSLPGFSRRLEPNSVAKYLTFSFVLGGWLSKESYGRMCKPLL